PHAEREAYRGVPRPLRPLRGAIIHDSVARRSRRPKEPLSPSRGRLTVDRGVLKAQLQQDGVEYLLVQFVDVHGAPKVKMVPADALDDVADTGAGFAGGAVWGLGQDASSHDMMARIDPPSYTPLPWKPGLARFAADLYVDGRPHPFCP